MAVTYNTGTDTVTLTGTEANPDSLDMIVAAVANSAKASKAGGYSYFFSFANLDGRNGFLQFHAESLVTFTSTLWNRSGSTGGVIFRERSVVRHEGNGFQEGLMSVSGYKIIAIRDAQGVNPRYILATNTRYDLLAVVYTPLNTTNYQISGLDFETIGVNDGAHVSSSVKLYLDSNSTVSNFRVLSRDTMGCDFQARSGVFKNLSLEKASISTSTDSGQTITLDTPTFNFLGVNQSFRFLFNSSGTININDPIFPNGMWTGNYTGLNVGFRNNPANLVNVSYSCSFKFLAGATPVKVRVRFDRNDSQLITATANTSGEVSQLLLTSTKNGSGFTGPETQGPNAIYSWSAKARKYEFKVAGGNDVIYSAKTFNTAESLTVQCETVPFLSLREDQATELTGLALVAISATSGTLTISESRTPLLCWHYYRQWVTNFANFNSNDSWDFNGTLIDIAGWGVVVSGSFTGNIKSLVSTAITGNITTSESQFGGSITSNKSLNLTGCTFVTGTTIENSTVIPITVTVSSLAGITAGENVTLQAPQASIRLYGLPNVANVILYVKNLTTNAVLFPTVISGEATVIVSENHSYQVRADAPGYLASEIQTIAGTIPEFQFNLIDYRSIYDQGLNISAQVLFDYATASVIVKDTTATIRFVDMFRTIEDYMATQTAIAAYDKQPYPVVLPDRNIFWFPTTDNGQPSPVRIKPHPANTTDPAFLFEAYFEGAADTTYGGFDFTGANGRIIRVRSVVAIAQINGSGGGATVTEVEAIVKRETGNVIGALI